MKNKIEPTIPNLIGKSLIISSAAIPTLAIIGYFCGWQYINEYFSQFGINRSSFTFNEFTIFIYIFSVVANIPSMINSLNPTLIYSILLLIVSLIPVCFFYKIPKLFKQIYILRIWIFLILSIILFMLSKEAGRIDANKVLSKQARQISVEFTKSFKEDLAAFKGESYTKQKIEEIRNASEKGALALIWRNTSETIILMFGITGNVKGKPIEILRISNSKILYLSSTLQN